MNQATTIISIVAMCGWLFLAVRAYHARDHSFERTALTVVVWVILFAAVALLAGRFITRQPI